MFLKNQISTGYMEIGEVVTVGSDVKVQKDNYLLKVDLYLSLIRQFLIVRFFLPPTILRKDHLPLVGRPDPGLLNSH